jgi:hypothetical protein
VSQGQPDDRDKTLVRQLTEHVLPLVGIAAALAYATLRLAYAHFYYKFDVAPEEVGLGQFQLLSQSFVGLVSVFVYLVAIALFASLIILPLGGLLFVLGYSGRRLVRSVSELLRRRKQRPAELGAERPQVDTKTTPSRPNEDTDSGLRRFVVRFLVLVMIFFVLLTFRQFSVEADRAANGVIEDGFSITTAHYSVGAIRLILLDIVAWPATIEWRGPSAVSCT